MTNANAAPGTTDPDLSVGLSVNQVLGIGAGMGFVGWTGTQYVARNPGRALEVVGVEGTVLVLLYWLLATITITGVILGVGARAVKYSPPFWLWGVLVALAMTSNAAVIAGLVPESMAGYALWHPWIGVYAIGYLVMGIVAVERSRTAYLAGSLLAVLVLAAWLAFPLASSSWVFALTGAVHAGPMLADVVLASAEPSATDRSAGSTREP